MTHKTIKEHAEDAAYKWCPSVIERENLPALVDDVVAAINNAIGEWQPIATAPRDTWVLLASRQWHRVRIGIRPKPGELHGFGFWLSDGGTVIDVHPTHWRPLPDMPTNDG